MREPADGGNHHWLSSSSSYAFDEAPICEQVEEVCHRVTVCRAAEVPLRLAGDPGQIVVDFSVSG